jgi:hypothetical protein
VSSTVASNKGKGSAPDEAEDVTTNGSAGDDDADQGGRGPFNLTDKQKQILVVVLVIHLILARLTWRDLKRRPEPGVRGRKGLWRTWSFFNTTGSLAYWTLGRRRLRGSDIETAVE